MLRIKLIILIFSLYLLSFNLFSQNNDYIIKFKSVKNVEKVILQSNNQLIPVFNFKLSKKFTQIQSNNSFNPQLYYSLKEKDANQVILSQLKNNEEIEYIEKNRTYRIEKSQAPNDSFYQYQWALKAINADKIWNKANGEGIIVGLIDTGIDFEHEDLKNQLWINSGEDINHNGRFDPWSNKIKKEGVLGDFDGLDNDMNGFADDVIGYDFVDQTYAKFGDWSERDPVPEDEGNHGTGVAGVIAAEGNNSKGIIGVAPKSKILTAKVFDITGNAETDDIAAGIIYAVSNGAKIINMSFGDPFESHLLRDVVNYANSIGCILVASSGNENNGKPHFPSDFDCVISVGASNAKNQRSQISNFGVNLSILAPGEDILTCEPGNDYTRLNGTSFSAPYVSGAVALMLQLNPNLTSVQIRSTLEAEANRINTQGWDKLSGAGILNLEPLINEKVFSEYEILNLKNYFNIDKGIIDQNIYLNVKTPLFDSWSMDYITPDMKNIIKLTDNMNFQTESIIEFPKLLKDIQNDFILSLKINLKNGQFLRRNKFIRLITDSNKLEIEYTKIIPAIQNGKRVFVISAKTNKPASFNIAYFPKSSPSLVLRRDEVEKMSQNHMIILDELPAKGEYSGKMNFGLLNHSGIIIDTISQDFNFNFEPLVFSTMNYEEKPYKLPRGYLNDIVKDIYNNGKSSIILNNMENIYIGNTEVYEFNNNSFVRKDTSAEGWIPIKFGDSKGTGSKSDLVSTQSAKTIITTSSDTKLSPYSKMLFQSQLGKTFWAEGFYDFDKDGIDEILAYNDTTYFTYKFQNGQYSLFQILEFSSGKKRGVTKGSVVGDFDGDGNIEVVHSNYSGQIFIFEFKDNKFSLEWQDSTEYGASTPVFTTIKLPDSNYPSIIIGTNGSQILFDEQDDYESIWSYRIINSYSRNSYKISNFENILGVRAGIEPRTKLSYRNGISKGDIDNDSNEELIISAFPNTYVMKWKDGRFQPIWQYKYSFTNSAIIFDFDKNGKNEIGIATYDSTKFFEINIKNDKLENPIVKEAFSTKNNAAIIKWFTVTNAEKYKLYTLIPDNNGLFKIEFLKEVKGDSTYVSKLEPYNYHYFLLSSINSSFQNPESDFSELIEIYTHDDNIYPKSINVVSSNSIQVIYSGKLKSILANMNYFELLNNKMEIQYPTSIQAINDTIYLLAFSQKIENGQYQLFCRSFPDFWNSPTVEKLVEFTVNIPESNLELYLISLDVIDKNKLLLSFSENVTDESDIRKENYSILPYGKILSVEKKTTNSVTIYLDDEIKNRNLTGEKFILTAKNLISENSHVLTDGPGSSLAFVLTKESLEFAFTFPNPFSLSRDEYLKIGNLSAIAEIEIMNLNGKILKTLSEKSADGGIIWDLKDKSGQKLDIGIYLIKIRGINSQNVEIESELHKFAVIP